jgi:hypothetical protein
MPHYPFARTSYGLLGGIGALANAYRFTCYGGSVGSSINKQD